MYEDELHALIFPLRFTATVNSYAVDELFEMALDRQEESFGPRGIALAVLLAEVLGFGDMLVDVGIRMLRSSNGAPNGVALAIRWPEDTVQSEALASLNADPRLELHIASERLAGVLSALEERPLRDKISLSSIAEIWRRKPETEQESVTQHNDIF